jgi:hypothetical protein
LKDAARNRLLQALAVLGSAAIIVGVIPSPFESSAIVAWLTFFGIALVITSACLFGALNPRYRRIKILSRVFTLPRALVLAGPVIFDIAVAFISASLLYPGRVATEILSYVNLLGITGSFVSSIDLVMIVRARVEAKDIELGL